MSKRPSFQEIYLHLAETLSKRSTCKRLQVGTVITSEDFRKVLAVGYNGNATGLENTCDRDEPGNCGCFPPNVLVQTDKGTVPIQDIKVGDLVLTHMGRYRPVTAVLRKKGAKRNYIKLSAGHKQENSCRFVSTIDHPIMVERAGEMIWVKAGNLVVGDVVLRNSPHVPQGELGQYNGFSKIQVRSIETMTRTSPIYNLEVEEDNSYVCQGLVVHNCLHSEENAVINCDCPRSTPKIVFVTHHPCIACAKRLINLGNVKRVYYRHEYRCTESKKILAQVGIDIVHLPAT